jgi:hypothetical protein
MHKAALSPNYGMEIVNQNVYVIDKAKCPCTLITKFSLRMAHACIPTYSEGGDTKIVV